MRLTAAGETFISAAAAAMPQRSADASKALIPLRWGAGARLPSKTHADRNIMRFRGARQSAYSFRRCIDVSDASCFGPLVTMAGTSFLSGIFGMAGGLILLGVLLALLAGFCSQ